MTDKNIQLKIHTGDGQFDKLFPVTKAELVEVGNKKLDETLQDVTAQLAQTDTKISRINNTVYLEDNERFALETTEGWIGRVVNNSEYGRVLAKAKKTYYINNPIKITTSNTFLDFNGAILASQGSVTNQFEIENANNVTVQNVFAAKTETDTGSFLKATNVTDLTVRNIKGSLSGFDNVLELTGVARSRFHDINIKNSNGTKKGIGIQLHYCVNIDFHSIYLEYFSTALLLSETKSQATTGYMNEGVSIDSFFSIKSSVGIECRQCTQLNLSNIILDFCSDFGIRVENANSLTVSQYWLGLQDGAVSGFELVNGSGVFMKMGTVAGDWTKQATQKAFFSAVDTPMTIDGVYMIDIHGGNLDRSKIEVNGDYYYHSGQNPIAKSVYGMVVSEFSGKNSTNDPLVVINMPFSLYTFQTDNPNNYIKSEGYVNQYGAIHMNKIVSSGNGDQIKHTSTDYNVTLETSLNVSSYKTVITRNIPKPIRTSI